MFAPFAFALIALVTPGHDSPAVGEHPAFTQPAPAVIVVADVTPPTPQPTPPVDGCDGQVADSDLWSCFGNWAGVVRCESGGNPQAINPRDTDGLPALGLIQFKQATFDYVVKHLGRDDLIGVDPRTLPGTLQIEIAEYARVHVIGINAWGCSWAYGRP